MPASRTSSPLERARLDPRAPFVVDTHTLGRRPGSMQQLVREAPAPISWRLQLAEVAADAPVSLRLRLESVVEGVLVSGEAEVAVAAECGRCLEPIQTTVVADVQELFGYEPDPEDREAPVLHGELLDLEDLIRDAVVLAMPLNPVCREDCEGLCPACGERLRDLPLDHEHQSIDPRWAALARLRPAGSSLDETEI